MAFGDSAFLLTDFSGPDENPLSDAGRWAKLNAASGENLQRKTNAVSGTSSTVGLGSSYWTPTTFGPDCQAYVTVVAKSSAQSIMLRVTSPGGSGTWNGYWLQVEGTTWGFYSVTAAASSFLTSATQVFSNGDKIGFQIVGPTLTAFLYTGGIWSPVVSTINGLYSQAGYLALGIDQNVALLDDLYAGTITSPFAIRQQVARSRRTSW